MRIVVIGAVAAGTSAAAKARRNDEDAEIVIYEKDRFISYSGCGMPYFIGGEIEAVDSLVPRDPKFFKKKYNIDVNIGCEVLSIDASSQTVEIKNLASGETFTDKYDKLIIATGATPFKPKVAGADRDNVFFLRNINDAVKIRDYIDNNEVKNAVVVGTGFIGFEVLENLLNNGINSTIVELANKITPNLDEDMALYLEKELVKKSVSIKKNCSVQEIFENSVLLSNGEVLDCDIVIMATGVRPCTELATKAGVALGETKAIAVNRKMQTNIENIYACGDCVETFSAITGKPVYRPLGSTANKTGRIAGDAIFGGRLEYKGNLGTGIFKFLDITVASTGLSEKEAVDSGFDVEVCHNIKPSKPEYMAGREMVIKAVASKEDGRLLGVQIVGFDGVDKRIDVFATLITYKATVDELFHLDLAYAPPFSTTKDPVHYTGMILDNAIHSGRPLITADKLRALDEKVQLIDTRSADDYVKKGQVLYAVNISQANLRDEELELDKDAVTVTYCNKGVTGNASQNILINRGFKRVYNLSGGHRFFKATENK